jgi:signal transduction histidine kinase
MPLGTSVSGAALLGSNEPCSMLLCRLFLRINIAFTESLHLRRRQERQTLEIVSADPERPAGGWLERRVNCPCRIIDVTARRRAELDRTAWEPVTLRTRTDWRERREATGQDHVPATMSHEIRTPMNAIIGITNP